MFLTRLEQWFLPNVAERLVAIAAGTETENERIVVYTVAEGILRTIRVCLEMPEEERPTTLQAFLATMETYFEHDPMACGTAADFLFDFLFDCPV